MVGAEGRAELLGLLQQLEFGNLQFNSRVTLGENFVEVLVVFGENRVSSLHKSSFLALIHILHALDEILGGDALPDIVVIVDFLVVRIAHHCLLYA